MQVRLFAIALGFVGHAASAQPAASVAPSNADSCLAGIMAAEKRFALPPKLLQTIGLVESGRVDPASRRVTPWPWTINVAGVDHIFATKAAAIEAVRDLQKDGTRSIDVGCMQVNLMYHPNAFASLDEAFDPSTNTQYGARFLKALYQEIGNWPKAAAAYHSRTQEIGVTYETRVMAMWPLADQFPDDALQQRERVNAQDERDASLYTPEFAAELKQMRADRARLAAMSGRAAGSARPQATSSARPDDSRYTPEFAAILKEVRADHARLAAISGPIAGPVRQQTARPTGRDASRPAAAFAVSMARANGTSRFER